MPSSTLRRRLLPVLALAIAATVAPAVPSTAAEPAAANRAAAWLAGQLSDAGTVVAGFPADDGTTQTFTDYGRTIDAGLALLAARGHDDVLGRTVTSVSTPTAVIDYTGANRGGEVYAGATAKLAFFIEATGGDATAVGGYDLLAQLRSLVGSNGRVADKSAFGNFAGLFAQAFAILAFDTAGVAQPSGLVQGLVSAQCPDGSFPLLFPKAGETCTGSVDVTGLVLQALAAVDLGSSDAAQRAATWLKGQQQSNGSFPGEAPVNSTGYAAMGLLAVGADTRSAETYLAGQQNADGGLRRGAGQSTASDLFATAQALPALVGTTFQGAARTVQPQAIPCVTAVVALPQTTITATAPAVVRITGASGTTVELLAYSQPSTRFEVVRTVTIGNDDTASVVIKPGTNTRLYAKQQGCTAGESVVLNVRTALTLAVKRNGTRDYTFSGASLPARAGGLIVTLYRLTPDGRPVLAGQTRADATTGQWTLRRVFGGTGRFDFVVRTGQDLRNAPGSSNVRSLLVF